MFATIEEAEKAAAMLRRFGGQEASVHPEGDGVRLGAVLALGHGTRLEGWEELADFLLERRADPPDDGVTPGPLSRARAHLEAAHRTMPVPAKLFGDPVYSTLAALTSAIDGILEALT